MRVRTVATDHLPTSRFVELDHRDVARFYAVNWWNAVATWNTVQAIRMAVAVDRHVTQTRVVSTTREPAASGQCGGSLPSCEVMRCESRGDIHAENPRSSASGKWQILGSTWGHFMGYPTASSAPEWVQDAKARQIYAGGRGRSAWSC